MEDDLQQVQVQLQLRRKQLNAELKFLYNCILSKNWQIKCLFAVNDKQSCQVSVHPNLNSHSKSFFPKNEKYN